jgi:predicted HTH transcriptional regulator
MKYKVFVSGVQKELKVERRTVKDFVIGNPLFKDYFDVFLFEDSPAKSVSAEKSYLDEVRGTDIYIGLIGQKYGIAGRNKVSPTEAEFTEARKSGKQILIFIKGEDDADREPGVLRLINEIRNPKRGVRYKRFSDLQQLKDLVFASLLEVLKDAGIVGRGDFDERVCLRATFDDIDEIKVRWLLKMARAARKYPLKEDAPLEDILTHLDLLKDGKITNAAILLFGKNPHRFFLQAEVKCLQFSGTEVVKPFLNYQVYSGNLFEQVDKALAFVLDAIKFPVIQQSGTAQASRPYELPEFAVQEAIVNAVAHRNYNSTSGVQVMVFVDRVEIWNSGSLPPALRLEDLKKPHTSFPANPLIANVLYLGNYAQRAGSGTMEMVEQCRVQGTPEPEFILIRNLEFRSVLPRDAYTESSLSKLGLNERQLRAVRLAKEKGSISLTDFKVIYPAMTERTLSRDLLVLVSKKILKPKGEKKGRRYGL